MIVQNNIRHKFISSAKFTDKKQADISKNNEYILHFKTNKAYTLIHYIMLQIGM